LLVPGKVDISTRVDKQSRVLRQNPSETKLQRMQTLLIRLFLDLPDINLFWHMRCYFSLV